MITVSNLVARLLKLAFVMIRLLLMVSVFVSNESRLAFTSIISSLINVFWPRLRLVSETNEDREVFDA